MSDEFVRTAVERSEGGHDGAKTGAADIVNRDTGFLQGFIDTELCEATCATVTKHQAHRTTAKAACQASYIGIQFRADMQMTAHRPSVQPQRGSARVHLIFCVEQNQHLFGLGDFAAAIEIARFRLTDAWRLRRIGQQQYPVGHAQAALGPFRFDVVFRYIDHHAMTGLQFVEEANQAAIRVRL